MPSPFKIKGASATTLALALVFIIGNAFAQSAPKAKPHAASKASATGMASDKLADFDAARAYNHAKQMVEFGPHPSGSDAIKKAQDYIEKEFKSYGLKVTEDNFEAVTPRGAVQMKNIIGELPGEKPDIVLITGHYDTKLQRGFLGANDGGSSSACVLEMARALSKTKPQYTLWFVQFDGEEAVVDWNAMNGKDNTYGSRHLASKLKADGTLSRVKAMILVDMIGDKQLDIKREGESTRWLTDIIWNTASKIGYAKNYLREEHYISDDHLPFLQAGVPSVDLIDFNYGPDHAYWHTNEDTLDKISGESLKAVGDVIIRALPEIFKGLESPHPAPAKSVPQ
jgi:Zn-dependent M28 family amino/carboxypeptidase